MLNLRLVVSFIKFKLHYTVQPAHKERTFGESRYVIALGTLVPIVFFIAYILFIYSCICIIYGFTASYRDLLYKGI